MKLLTIGNIEPMEDLYEWEEDQLRFLARKFEEVNWSGRRRPET